MIYKVLTDANAMKAGETIEAVKAESSMRRGKYNSTEINKENNRIG
jgi:hypothetical protein